MGRREGRDERGGERDGQGGCVGSSVVQESGRKKCNVMRVLPLSESERERRGRNHTNLSLDGGAERGEREGGGSAATAV